MQTRAKTGRTLVVFIVMFRCAIDRSITFRIVTGPEAIPHEREVAISDFGPASLKPCVLADSSLPCHPAFTNTGRRTLRDRPSLFPS